MGWDWGWVVGVGWICGQQLRYEVKDGVFVAEAGWEPRLFHEGGGGGGWEH